MSAAVDRVKAFAKGVFYGVAATAVALMCAVTWFSGAAPAVFVIGAICTALCGVFYPIGKNATLPNFDGPGADGYEGRKRGQSAEVLQPAPMRAVSVPRHALPRGQKSELVGAGYER